MMDIPNALRKAASARVSIFVVGILTLSAFGIAHSQNQASSAAMRKLPLSLNEVMVALTDRSAEPFWSAAQKAPANRQQWDELEYTAMQVALSGVVISLPGTGGADAAWVSQAKWQDFAKQLTDVGMRGFAAAKAKNTNAISKVGDDLVEVCEGCHRAFKPEIPTQGIIMHSEYYQPK